MPVDTTTANEAVLEIERFEWAAPDRIEIVGYWTGLRGRRFMRPTLVLKGEGPEPRRLLALLEHKPWAAEDGEEWIAAFAWEGPVTKFQSADLNVATGIDVKLPPPRMRPGKPRRFRHRAVSRDGSREVTEARAARGPGIVSDAPKKPSGAKPKTGSAKAKQGEAASAKAKELDPIIAAELPGPPEKPEPTEAIDAPEPTVAMNPPFGDPPTSSAEPEPTVAMDEPIADPPAAPDAPAPRDPATARPSERDTETADAPSADAAAPDASDATEPPELRAARADVERLRRERDGFRRERDSALEKLRSVRGELEAERQAREKAVADGRAAERESANTMLAQGAELRAGVERQREIAYLERDDAKAERDRAVEAREKACAERDDAIAARKQAERERKEAFAQRDRDRKEAFAERDRDRKEAFAQRDRAVKLRERAEAERAQALGERDNAFAERESAMKERNEIVSVHERGLPVHPPKPRFLPEDHEQRSELQIWGPRGLAIGTLLVLAFIVLRLFSGI